MEEGFPSLYFYEVLVKSFKNDSFIMILSWGLRVPKPCCHSYLPLICSLIQLTHRSGSQCLLLAQSPREETQSRAFVIWEGPSIELNSACGKQYLRE